MEIAICYCLDLGGSEWTVAGRRGPYRPAPEREIT
jgi:hypothetical protein